MEARALEEESRLARSSGDDAFRHAITAAELYMSLLGDAQSCAQADRPRIRRKANDLITFAEFLRALNSWQQDRQITTTEARLLLDSSKLGGNEFPPWIEDPPAGEFALRPGQALYIDATEFTLSALQLDNISAWKRPADLFPARHRSQFMEAKSESDLVQDVTADCSVVASLCSAMKLIHDRRVLSGLMFPFNSETGAPQLSNSGKYIFRMNFNGCFRRVEIDDRLPASRTGRALFVTDRHNPGLAWPALVEKAYLKVRGGYDFPGSNSCTDLWVLTGWIPEQLFLQRDALDLDQRWNSIVESFRLGNVIVTLGTGRISQTEEEATGLVGEHDYGVLEIDSSPHRRVLVKNPWCTAQGWNEVVPPLGVESPDRLSAGAGTFWMSLGDVAQHFESMYLNWSPALFGNRQDHHFEWSLAARTNMSATVVDNPQYSLVAEDDVMVWILLARHFVDGEPRLSRERRGGPLAGDPGYMSICIFDNDGKKVQKPNGSAYSGPYVDSQQTLAKFEVRANRAYTVVPVQDKLPLSKCPFTLSFFSNHVLDVRAAKDAMTYYSEEQSAWTRRTAGGNSSSPSYGSNPQFSISVPQPGPLSLLLCTDNLDIAVHIDLIWAHGERVGSSLAIRDVLANSGDYVRGCAVLDVARVDAGTYTAVCSTFEPRQMADFTLRVGSRSGHAVRPVPPEGAGRLRIGLLPFSFDEGETARRATVCVSRLTRLSVTALCRSSHSSNDYNQHRPTTALRISVVAGRGPNEVTLAVSGDGEFREPTGCLRTSDVDIEPGRHMREGLWVVVERVGGYRSQETFQVELLSDGPVTMGDWEILEELP